MLAQPPSFRRGFTLLTASLFLLLLSLSVISMLAAGPQVGVEPLPGGNEPAAPDSPSGARTVPGPAPTLHKTAPEVGSPDDPSGRSPLPTRPTERAPGPRPGPHRVPGPPPPALHPPRLDRSHPCRRRHLVAARGDDVRHVTGSRYKRPDWGRAPSLWWAGRVAEGWLAAALGEGLGLGWWEALGLLGLLCLPCRLAPCWPLGC